MSIIKNLFHSRDKPKNSLPGSGYNVLFGRTTSGKNVNECTAMQVTAVYACVRILSEAIAGLPLHTYKSQKDAAKRIIEKCDFIRYCKENTKSLPELYRHIMVTNIATTKDVTKLVHELSQPYLKNNKNETNRKIRRAIIENKPHIILTLLLIFV